MIQYTIHEVAALLNISTDAIRLYEKEGLVTPTRNPENGYRYYNTEQIHRIMGICLYRKLHVSIAEIKRLVEVSTLEDISDGFSGFIDSRKKEIARLTLEVEQMSYMKQHLDTLDEGSRTISIQTLPAVYPLYHQDSAFLGYRTLKDVFHSPLFSMGNFSYILSVEPSGSCRVSALQFAIREPMLALTQLNSSKLPLSLHRSRISDRTGDTLGSLRHPEIRRGASAFLQTGGLRFLRLQHSTARCHPGLLRSISSAGRLLIFSTSY